MAFISSARSCAVICFFIRQSLKNLAVPTSKGVEIVESVSTAPATYSSLIPIGNRSHWSYVKATDWAWAAVVRDSRPRLTRRTRFSRGGLLDVVPCPLLAQSGHTLVHCTCSLSGVKRTCLFALYMSAFDPYCMLMVDQDMAGERMRIAILDDVHRAYEGTTGVSRLATRCTY